MWYRKSFEQGKTFEERTEMKSLVWPNLKRVGFHSLTNPESGLQKFLSPPLHFLTLALNMNKEASSHFFPEFRHPSPELIRFLQADKLFTILLKDGTVIHFEPSNTREFKKWLLCHKIEDVKDSARKTRST
jgi:hypothetical protein